MSIYNDLQAVTSDIMKDFKQGSIYLVKISQTGGTVDEPGTPTETSYELNATVRGVSYQYLKESFVLATDLEVTAAVLSTVTPDEDDFISIDSVKHKIIKDISVPATGTKVAWKFIVRKGG